jgi:hypothetical protein
MTDNSTRVLAHGGGRYTITSALASPQDLPPGTYPPNYNQMMGYSIVTLPDLEPPSYRVYGRRDETIAKVLRTYGALDRSLGVLFEGDKGIGKSSTTVELARQARDMFNLPVIIVNHNTPGLSDFLGTLGEAVIVFDEFEKNFPQDDDGENHQNQFLTLFDGTDATKRLYIVTVNETDLLSPYFLNRPGRFHYLISFDYPDIEAITEYFTNEAPEASQEQIKDAVGFAFRARLNYDHLRAIVTEMTIFGQDAKVSDLIADLNIRDTEERFYDVTVTLSDGTVLTSYDEELDLFSTDVENMEQVEIRIPTEDRSRKTLQVKFTGAGSTIDRRTNAVTIDPSTIVTMGLGHDGRDAARNYSAETLKNHNHDSDDHYLYFNLMTSTERELEKYKVKSIVVSPMKSLHGRFIGV